MVQQLVKLVCSTIKPLHDLSSDRRKPGQFLSSHEIPQFSTKGSIEGHKTNFGKFKENVAD